VRLRLLAAAVALAVGVIACGSPPATSTVDTSPVARVGGEVITRALFDARLQSAQTTVQQAGGPPSNAAMEAQLRAGVLRSLILDTVIAQEAKAAGVAATEAEIDAQVAQAAQQAGGTPALQTALAGAGGSLLQLRDEIASQLNEQRLEDVFAKQRAEQVESQLASGASFASLVTSMSDDTGTNTKGGDLGALTAADLSADDPAFAAAVRGLSVGAFTRTAVHDSGGYDILLLYAKTPTTWSVRHILVAAPTPYTVKDRPQWFTGALFETVAQLCAANEVHVFITDAGANPCSGAPTPAPSPGT